MTYGEYKEILNYELYRHFNGKLTLLQKIRIRYFQPNTNCMLMARKMWYYYQRGGVFTILSKILYLRIIRRYGCVLFPSAKIGRGFHITHPTGIVLGNCRAGTDFMIYQNCSVGGKRPGDDWPEFGNNVHLCTGSVVLGHIKIADDVVIGAQSLVVKDITESGIYGGNPLKRLG